MNTIARKYSGVIYKTDLDKEAEYVGKRYEKGRRWWIFKDGSALGLDKNNGVFISDKYTVNSLSKFNKPVKGE